MVLSDLIREIGELSVRSDRVKSDLKAWLNRGQRAIAQRYNWTFMHSQQSVTIAAAATSANLPVNFKELAAEKSPITYTAPLAQFPTPVRVRSRAELEGIGPGMHGNVVNASGTWTPFFVFIEQNDGGRWTINTPVGYPAAQNATYAVSCYLFPADLSLGTDHNPLTDDSELAEALINWVKAKAYLAEDSTDPKGMAATQFYEQGIRTALNQDARRRLAGRAIHW